MHVLFEHGASADDYWTHDQMVLQVEEAMDVMDALHSEPWNGIESPHNVFVPSTEQPNTRL